MTFDPAPPASSSQPSPPREPWRRGPRTFGHHHHHHRGPGIIPGLVLVAWGGLLLLRELGHVSPALRAIDFWPLVIVGLGLSMTVRRRHLGGALTGLAVMLLGAGLLAQRLGYAPGVARLWPVLVIAAGVGVILNGLTRRRVPRAVAEPVSTGDLQRSVTMGELALVVDSQQFRGGALGVTMGELRADLRRAAMATDEAVIELSLTMGNIELHVPGNWQIVSEVAPFMGVVEDRTEPRPDAAGVLKKLVVRGKLTMGAVTIKN